MNNCFTDRSGKTWKIEVTIGHLPKLRKIGVNLSKLIKAKTQEVAAEAADELLGDPERFGQALWVLINGDDSDVSPDDFGGLIDGPALAEATNAFLAAMVDFRHRPDVAKHMKNVQLPKLLEALDRASIAQLDRQLSTLSESAGN